jgi:predicted transcriptional regulator
VRESVWSSSFSSSSSSAYSSEGEGHIRVKEIRKRLEDLRKIGTQERRSRTGLRRVLGCFWVRVEVYSVRTECF